jgi:cytochrome oxidase assembly protein ShyY1
VYRFLLQRRWLGFVALTAVLCTGFVLAAQWQLDRNDQRQALNAVVDANVQQPPVPVERLLSPADPVGADVEWREVTATGTYDTGAQLLVRNRQIEGGGAGYEVLTPLMTEAGTAVLVNRGWVPAGATARTLPDVPPPPSGEVTVRGRVRLSETTPDREDPPAGQVIAIDLPRVAQALPYPLYGGYVQASSEQPAPTAAPVRLPVAETVSGPHLSYAVQWVLFLVVAVVGGVILLRREAADRSRSRAQDLRGDAHHQSQDSRGEPAWQD